MKLREFYTFETSALLEEALTHRSHAHEYGHTRHNERLELLGDAVIGLILTDHLLTQNQQASEGEISKRRSQLVNETSLAYLAQHLELGRLMRLGKGETSSGGALKPRLLASCFEAVVGALYLDAGFVRTKELVTSWFQECLDQLYLRGSQDYKTELQERVQEKDRQLPIYELVEETGPAHERWFHVQVRVGPRVLAIGEGKSKRIAEQHAARLALEVYK